MCNTQNSLLLNQHNGDDAPQDYNFLLPVLVISYNKVVRYAPVSVAQPCTALYTKQDAKLMCTARTE